MKRKRRKLVAIICALTLALSSAVPVSACTPPLNPPSVKIPDINFQPGGALEDAISNFDTSLIAEMYVTIAQGEKTVLEKTLSDCSCSGTSVSLALTQEDTLRLQQQPHSRAEMQIRVRTTAGEALASDIMRVYVGRILKEGVI